MHYPRMAKRGSEQQKIRNVAIREKRIERAKQCDDTLLDMLAASLANPDCKLQSATGHVVDAATGRYRKV